MSIPRSMGNSFIFQHRALLTTRLDPRAVNTLDVMSRLRSSLKDRRKHGRACFSVPPLVSRGERSKLARNGSCEGKTPIISRFLFRFQIVPTLFGSREDGPLASFDSAHRHTARCSNGGKQSGLEKPFTCMSFDSESTPSVIFSLDCSTDCQHWVSVLHIALLNWGVTAVKHSDKLLPHPAHCNV